MTYTKEIRDKKIEDLNLRIIGVRHILNFFKKNEDFFKREIDKSDHIFFEDGFETNLFYRSLGELVKNRNMSIYVPDSSNMGHDIIDSTMVYTGVFVLKESINPIIIDRREFLRGCLALTSLFLMSGYLGLREKALQNLISPEATLDNRLSYDSILDYRNIVSAENLERGARELDFKGNATYFIGDNHVDGISAYLKNPKMRRKRILYPLQNLITDTKIKEYRNINGEWEIVRRI